MASLDSDVTMVPVGEPSGSAGPSASSSSSSEKPKRFEIKKWNAVALWAWDIVVDNCAICRNHIMDLCIECQANQASATSEECTVAWVVNDVYRVGVVLLKLLTGRRSVDKTRPNREQNLAEKARLQLNDSRKLTRIMDPRLEGQYSEVGAQKAAAWAYQCLSHRPKHRPTMSTVVKTLEPLQDYQDIPVGPFVYAVPSENDLRKEETTEGGDAQKEPKKESSHRGHRLKIGSPKSPTIYSETALHQNLRNSPNSPLHPRSRGR